MKQTKSLSVLIFWVTVVVMFCVMPAFTDQSISKKKRTDWTNYFWFSANGTYLRQNLVDDEIDLTGLDEFPYAPYTVREKGYTPANVSGNPPAPINPYYVSKWLYSHP
ncbi:hypothetical protein [Niastella populi]|uniref:Uncharacterized protein n=1 Tax=Niastella populi TaxID=550983 RepID=A0A1V9GAI8_9BACT|nr:hypothetical protein [Niastella populi]OQP67679.1 hypothetical protein A4R26_11490 [Niastella populi]